ncbi:MAG: Flp family type IVb pilin [Proteobacteria bacterium]|nr:Flp family type IVb pilin [Pseudomonadota bacterium]
MSWERVKKFYRDEEGQGMTEYILIVLLIAIVAIAAFKFFGKRVSDSVQKAGSTLSTEADKAVKEGTKNVN